MRARQGRGGTSEGGRQTPGWTKQLRVCHHVTADTIQKNVVVVKRGQPFDVVHPRRTVTLQLKPVPSRDLPTSRACLPSANGARSEARARESEGTEVCVMCTRWPIQS